MKRLHQLCRAVRAISPEAQVIFRGVADHEDAWVVRVMASDLILIETGAGPLDKVMAEAVAGMGKLSERVRAQLLEPTPEEPPTSPGRKGRSGPPPA